MCRSPLHPPLTHPHTSIIIAGMKTLLPLLVLSFAIQAAAQQPDRWRGLIIDESSPEEAKRLLGEPKTDKESQSFRPLKFNEWFDVKNKNFRILHYENASSIDGFSDVKLVFRDAKLVVISLEPKKLEAHAVSRSYDGDFVFLSDKFAESTSPEDFERNQGRSYPKSFPTVYYLMNKASNSYVFVMVANDSFASILGKSVGVRDASESLPGKIAVIQLISRRLEDSKGVDLLK
jgi:hypothetical protein